MPSLSSFSILSPSLPNAFFLQKPSSRNYFPVIHCTSPRSAQQDLLFQSVAEANGNSLPCVRTFENDLARLSLVGSVSFDQALLAAAADGGQAASEHIDSGIPAMVVETVFPGPADEHATVSTRLFLPAKKVKEKARKLRSSLPKEMAAAGMTAKNILAMTFRQVVLQQLWNFELLVFRPGTIRNMKELENPREVPASFLISSTDERVISVLAEAVCVAALQNTERQFLNEFFGRNSSSFLQWFWKRKEIASKDSSVVIYKLFEDEIVENAMSLLESFNSTKKEFKGRKKMRKHNWWIPLAQSKLDRIGGPEFSAWASEYVPAYKIQIDADKVKDVNFQGWRKSAGNKWEVLLTHSQMVGLAEVLDMYYEDAYSLPNKELPCSVVTNFNNLSNKKLRSSLMNILAITVASGIFFITLGALCWFCFPQVRKGLTYGQEQKSLPSSEIDYVLHESLDDAKLQEFCIIIIKKLKDAFGWPDDIEFGTNKVAWIGDVPDFLKKNGEADSSSETVSSPIQKEDEYIKSSASEIASYQVVLSTDGKIVGFQPTSRVGENHWAANPLAKELYSGQKLSPGVIESDLKILPPNEAVVLELLMSVNTDAHFALARPVL